jgi:hypothetical protein
VASLALDADHDAGQSATLIRAVTDIAGILGLDLPSGVCEPGEHAAEVDLPGSRHREHARMACVPTGAGPLRRAISGPGQYL